MEQELLDIARDFLEKVTYNLDPYSSEKGRVLQTASDTMTLLTPGHIHFAKNGRGPGKNPPLDPILEWVQREGVIFDGTDEEGTAYALQSLIAANGTLNWVPDAPDALEEAININSLEMSEEISKHFTIRVKGELNEELVRTFNAFETF